MTKSGHGYTFCKKNKTTSRSEYLLRCLYVWLSTELCQHYSVSTVQDVVTKLYRSVTEIKLNDEFEVGCRPCKGARSKEIKTREGPLAPHFYRPGSH